MHLRQVLDRHPSLKAGLKAVLRPFRRQVSADYRVLPAADRDQTLHELKTAWQDADIPRKQHVGVVGALSAYKAGQPMRDFDALVAMLRPLAQASPGAALLEIGCSSGYYAEVLAARGLNLRYSGCDYSHAFVEMARTHYPELTFRVEDATQLSYRDGEFDIVVSGCCLLHIADYRAAIAETARVARRHAIFHRTPVLHTQSTQFFTKLGYGIKMVEIHFNEEELVSLFTRHGLQVVGIATLATDWRNGDAFATKTYLCEKKDT